MIVANPIYDIVFKYLMEDERIASTILSAMMKQEVVEVHMRYNGYRDYESDNYAIYRIVFEAVIIDEKGQKQVTLIEVQKTEVELEVLHYHNSLKPQYANSIIVQISCLHGKVNNRLDKVLSIFDQSLQEGKASISCVIPSSPS